MRNEYNRRQKWAVFFLDIIILLELTVSLYWANQYGDELTKMFLFSYLPMVVVTLIIGKRYIRSLAPLIEAPVETDGQRMAFEPVSDTHVVEKIIEKMM